MNIKKLITSWHFWVMVILILVLIGFSVENGSILTFFPIILIVCCMAMMFMMKDKNHKH